MTDTWPRVACPGSRPNCFVAFVQLDADSPQVRIKFREAIRAPRWKCDEHGKSRDAHCEHARAVLPLTTQKGWAEQTRIRKADQMTEANPESPISPTQVRAVCLLYRSMIDAGRTHDDAAEFVSLMNPARLVTDDDEVDIAKIARTAERFAPTELDRSSSASSDRYMTAVALVEGMVSGDRAVMGLLPAAPPETLALFAAQTAVTAMVLDNWCRGHEAEVLRTLRALILAHVVDAGSGQ